jgi:hypothetical protein
MAASQRPPPLHGSRLDGNRGDSLSVPIAIRVRNTHRYTYDDADRKAHHNRHYPDLPEYDASYHPPHNTPYSSNDVGIAYSCH